MQGADLLVSEWKYIPVRRTALFIERACTEGPDPVGGLRTERRAPVGADPFFG